jgi:hypothetical protein
MRIIYFVLLMIFVFLPIGQAQEHIQITSKLIAYSPLHDGYTNLIKVLSNDKINVYVDEDSIENAINTKKYVKSDTFKVRLYFEYLDEEARQQAIKELKEKIGKNEVYTGIGRPETLKYICMDVTFNQSNNNIVFNKFIYNATHHIGGAMNNNFIDGDNVYRRNTDSFIGLYSVDTLSILTSEETPTFFNIMQNVVNLINK